MWGETPKYSVKGVKRLMRKAALVTLLLVVLGIIAFGSIFGRNETTPVRTPQIEEPTTKETPIKTMPKATAYAGTSLEGEILSAGFVGKKFIYISAVEEDTETQKRRTIYLVVFSLSEWRELLKVKLEQYSLDNPPCTTNGEGYSPSYRLVGSSDGLIYYARACPKPVPGATEPRYNYTIYYVEESTVSIKGGVVTLDDVVAFSGTLAYKYRSDCGSGSIEALDLATGSTLWRNNFNYSFLFQTSGTTRIYCGKFLAAYPAMDGSIYVIVWDRGVPKDSSEEMIVIGIVRSSKHGVGVEYYQLSPAKPIGYKPGILLTQSIRVERSPQGSIYIAYAVAPSEPARGAGHVTLAMLDPSKGYFTKLLETSVEYLSLRLRGLQLVPGNNEVVLAFNVEYPLVEITWGNRTFRGSFPATVVKVVKADGSIILDTTIPHNLNILGFTREGEVLLLDGRYVYILSRNGVLWKTDGDIGPLREVGVGVVFVPIFIPIIPFMEKPQLIITAMDTTVYVYKEPSLRAIEVNKLGKWVYSWKPVGG